MGFWEDASPAVKGAIIIGGILLLYLGVAKVAGIFPYGAVDAEQTQVRGMTH